MDAQGNCTTATSMRRPRLKRMPALSYDNHEMTPNSPTTPGPLVSPSRGRYSLSMAKGSIGLEIRSALDMDHAPSLAFASAYLSSTGIPVRSEEVHGP